MSTTVSTGLTDEVYVGVLAADFDTGVGNVSGIVGPVDVTGDGSLFIDDSSNDAGQSVTITANGVMVGSAAIDYDPTVTVEFVIGDGDNTWIIDNSDGLVSPDVPININGGAGNDLLIVTGDPGDITGATYTPGPTADAGTITSTNGAVTQTINFTGFEPVEFLMPTPNLTVNVGGADDTVNIVQDGTSSVNDPITGVPELLYEVNFDGAFESIAFRNQAALTVNTEGGLDAVTMNLPTQLDDSLASVAINSGLLDDSVQVLATPAGVSTSVDLGPGLVDEAYIGVLSADYDTGVGTLSNIQGTVDVIDSDFGGLFVDNSGDTAGDSYTFTDSSITGTGFAPITYSNTFLDQIELLGGSGDDTYDVQSTSGLFGTVATRIEDFGGTNDWTVALDSLGFFSVVNLVGGPGDDTFNVNAGTGFNASFLNIDGGGGGNDLLTVNGSALSENIVLSLTGDAAGTFSGFGFDWTFSAIENTRVNAGGGSNSFLLVDNTDTVIAFSVAPQSATSALILPDFGFTNPAIFIADINNGFTINGDGDSSGDADTVSVFAPSTTGLGSGFELEVANGSDNITVDQSHVAINNATVGSLLTVNLVTSTLTNLDVFGGSENPQIGDTVFAYGSAIIDIFVDGNLPAVPADPGDTIVLSTTGDAKVFNDPITGPPNVQIQDSAGGSTVEYVNFETIRLYVGSGVLNVIGDIDNTTPFEDYIEVVGTAPKEGLLWLNDPAHTQGALQFTNVSFLNVYSGDSPDTLEITPYADNTPQGWDLAVFFDEGGPIPIDLLIVNGVAGVSEDTVIQPSDSQNGQVVVTQAITNVPIVIINYVSNLGIIVNANDGSLGDTDSLTLRDAAPSLPNASGNSTVVANGNAAGTAADPIVTVADSVAGPLYQLESVTNLDRIRIELGSGNDTATITNAPALRFLVDAGAGNDFLQALGAEPVTLWGGFGDDTLIGGDGDDSLAGETGDDVLVGGPGNDTLDGGDGSDDLEGGLGDDVLQGGSGQDFIDPGLGFNNVDGGSGQDWLQLLNFPLDSFTARASGSNLLLNYGAFEGVNAANIDTVYVQFAPANPNPVSAVISDLSTTAVDAFLIDVPTNGVGDSIEIQGSNVADNIGVAVETIAPNFEPLTVVTMGWGKVSLGLTESTDGDTLLIDALNGDDTVTIDTAAVNGPSGSTVLTSVVGGNGNDLLQSTGTLSDIIPPVGVTLEGGDGDDTLIGSPFDDFLSGGAGNDLLMGFDGDDTLNGGDGDDTLEGGAGTNVIDGGAGFDVIPILGTNGADTIDVSGVGVVTIAGSANGDGTNTVSNVELLDIQALAGDDTVTVSTDAAIGMRIDAGEGDDLVDASTATGPATVLGGAGSDTLTGTSGADSIFGGDGNDQLNGLAGIDTMDGGSGNDTLVGGAGGDFMIGGDNSDTFIWNPGDGADTLEGGDGDDAAIFNGGAAASNDYTLGRSGIRFLLTRAQGGSINSAEVEHVSLTGGNAIDTINVGDLSLTDVRLVDIDLNPGGPDAVEDEVRVNGSNTSDDVGIVFANGQVEVQGLSAQVDIQNSTTLDCLCFMANAGNDSVEVVPPVMQQITVNVFGGFGDDSISGGNFAYGGDGNDTLVGTEGPDTLLGGAGDDSIVGLGGNDELWGDATTSEAAGDCCDRVVIAGGAAAGNDTIRGGAGNDIIRGQGGDDSLFGDAGNDQIVAGDGDDTASGGAGDDSIVGGAGNDSLSGDAGNDIILGQDGKDTIAGGDGDDFLLGQAGDDSISGNDGDDTIYGGAGDDTAHGGKGADQIVGEAGDDLLFGDADNDVIRGGDGDDTLVGNDGDDVLMGENGDDSLLGGDGNDILFGQAGDDTLRGGDGTDTLLGDIGDDLLYGDNGADWIDGGAGDDTAYGGDGNDSILGQAGNDLLYGEGGNDKILGGDGDDTAYGGDGDDSILGEAGNDLIFGNTGNDVVFAGAGNDTVHGDDGNDTLVGEAGNDLLSGDAGNDAMDGGLGNDTLDGGIGDDRMLGRDGNDAMMGGPGNDWLLGGAGNDSMSGGDGSDTLCGEAGNDLMAGNDGNDLMIGGIGNDTEFGGAGNDTMFGGAGDDSLDAEDGDDFAFGNEGNDTLRGGDGNDSLDGGVGNDVVIGGFGNDTLVGDLGDDMLHGGDGRFRPVHVPVPSGPSDGNDILVGGDGFDRLDAGNGNNVLDAGDDNFRETMVAGDGNDDAFVHTNRGRFTDVAALDGGFNVTHDLGAVVAPPSPPEPPCDSAGLSVITIFSATPPSGPAITNQLAPPVVLIGGFHGQPIQVVPITADANKNTFPRSGARQPRPEFAFWA